MIGQVELEVHPRTEGSIRGPAALRLHVDDQPWASPDDGRIEVGIQPGALKVLGAVRGTLPA